MSDKQPASPYQLDTARLQWSQQVPEASQYGDIYFSRQHGLDESRFVFLQHNHLPERWQQLAAEQCFTIGETGFGTGLNFLSAWQLWQRIAPSNARLHFVSVEKHPLTPADLRRALASWPELNHLAAPLLAQYPSLTPGQHVLHFDDGRVTLHLLLGDAIESLEQLRCSNHPGWHDSSPCAVDAWFLDGFAPAKNPSLWNTTLYALLADLSQSGTTLATFTAVGAVRRGLIEQGFAMAKVEGFGRKREMLRGRFEAGQRQSKPTPAIPRKAIKAPWTVNPNPPLLSQSRQRHVAIIGGGLAGASSAYAMARRGWQVTLIERAGQLAQGASGNPQGMLYTKLSPEAATLNQFTLSSYLYALRFYRHWQQRFNIAAENVDFCGVLQLATTTKSQQMLSQLRQVFASHPELVQFVDGKQASAIAGVAIDHPGWWFPKAGWLSPVQLCRTLSCQANITVLLEQEVIDICRDQQHWQLLDQQQRPLARCDAVIIANSRDARHFAMTRPLPIKTIRGQISLVEASRYSGQLNTVLCHEGYVTPAIQGCHSLGATFAMGDSDTTLRPEDHRQNLRSLQRAVPTLFDSSLAPEQLAGRASLRCSSPDYLPMVGPVPDHGQFISDYAALRSNALTDLGNAGRYYPNLYLNIAHGSRGLTSTPLCSEVLAAMINNEPPPLPRNLLAAINPARFVIRDLIRNKC